MITDFRENTMIEDTIQAVIFDLDGVLVDSEWLSFQEWQKLAQEYGGNLDSSVFPELIGITAEATAEAVMHHARIDFDVTESCAFIWQRVTERLSGKLDPLPGSCELLSTLAQHGYPLGLASNSLSGYIQNTLQGLGMSDFFPVWVSRDQVAEGKPAPDVYLLAAERLGIAPERCLAIEDSRVGVQAASAAGMRVVAVPRLHPRPIHFHQAWQVYSSLTEVTESLDAILR